MHYDASCCAADEGLISFPKKGWPSARDAPFFGFGGGHHHINSCLHHTTSHFIITSFYTKTKVKSTQIPKVIKPKNTQITSFATPIQKSSSFIKIQKVIKIIYSDFTLRGDFINKKSPKFYPGKI